MNKKTHLARWDRDMIKSMLDEKCNFTQIAAAIGKDRTTVSREVRNRAITVRCQRGRFSLTPFALLVAAHKVVNENRPQ